METFSQTNGCGHYNWLFYSHTRSIHGRCEKNNDGSTLNHILASNVQDIKNWVESEDIFIVDGGFRDSMEFLEDIGIKAKMPSFIPRGQAQMSTEEANTSRLVKKVCF